MPPDDEKKTPAEVHYLGGGDDRHQPPSDSKRSPRRQYLAERLHAAGPRPVLEALLAVADGHDLDWTLEN